MIVAVCCAPGSAGSTTTALGLAACWPAGDAVLAELDPSGGDVASWHELALNPGVMSASASAGVMTVEGLLGHTQQIPGGPRVLVAPVHPGEATGALKSWGPVLLPMCAGVFEVLLVADCGRVMPGPPAPVLGYADAVVLVVRQQPLSDQATVAATSHAQVTADWLRSAGVEPFVAVLGDRPYPPADVAGSLDADLIGVIAEDPIGAAWLAGRPGSSKRSGRSHLVQSLRPIAEQLARLLVAAR